MHETLYEKHGFIKTTDGRVIKLLNGNEYHESVLFFSFALEAVKSIVHPLLRVYLIGKAGLCRFSPPPHLLRNADYP